MKTSTTLVAMALVAGLHATASAQAHLRHDANAEKSRAQVRTELMTAIAHGEMIAENESGKRHRDISPDLYPKHDSGVGKTPAQIIAEWQEAKRLERGLKSEVSQARRPARHSPPRAWCAPRLGR